MNEFYLSTEFVLVNNKEPINQQIYRFLKRAIIECRLMPGDPLSENAVSSKFKSKVSRQPVREALIKLAKNDFVIISPKKATRVAPINRSDILQGAEIRCAIEGYFIRKAAELIDLKTLNFLKDNIKKQEQAAKDYNIRDHFALDDEFHSTILNAAGAPKAWNMIESVKGVMDRVRFLSLENELIPMGVTSKAHEKILAALEKHNAQEAEKAMLEHVLNTRASLESTMAKCRKDWFID